MQNSYNLSSTICTPGLFGDVWLENKDEFHLVIPPEGTRKKRPYWKSGFYHIARGANIPVTLAILDYGKKQGGFGPQLFLTGNEDIDLQSIKDHYSGITGKYPAKMSEIKFSNNNSTTIN